MTVLWRAAWCLVPLGLAFAVQNRFTLSVLAIASTLALFVASWDLIGGTSGQPTLGHALPWGAGDYAAAFVAGWLEADRSVDELLTSFARAGADVVITYFAKEYAKRHG